jgi:hypothetical protein
MSKHDALIWNYWCLLDFPRVLFDNDEEIYLNAVDAGHLTQLQDPRDTSWTRTPRKRRKPQRDFQTESRVLQTLQVAVLHLLLETVSMARQTVEGTRAVGQLSTPCEFAGVSRLLLAGGPASEGLRGRTNNHPGATQQAAGEKVWGANNQITPGWRRI